MHPNGNTLRVVLADVHPFFRQGLRGILEAAGLTVVGEAEDGNEAAMLAGELTPDVIVIDPNMPDVASASVLREVSAAKPETRVVVLTTSVEGTNVIEAIATGASAYLLKDMQPNELVSSIRQAANGCVVLSPGAARALVGNATPVGGLGEAPERPSLTARETDVLRLVVAGADNGAIGVELSISRHTVKQHVTNIFEKLGVRTRVEAAVYAVRAGLV